jgi:hypothetical protein
LQSLTVMPGSSPAMTRTKAGWARLGSDRFSEMFAGI